jgi:hypothetical protein
VIDYVDLKRNFIAIPKDAERDLAIGRLWGRKYGGWLEWPEVLDHERVVLLAEAQSGKTEEFKHTAAGLRERGRPAFYTTIEQLAESRFMLSPADRALFEAWQAGSDRAWFFLDSIDEARLNQKKFDAALRHLALEIGTALARASVLVSCRVSDWKNKSDRRTILDILPVPKTAPGPAPPSDPDAALLDPIFERNEPKHPKRGKDVEKKPDMLVVQLVPLTEDQRRTFAQAAGIRDVDAFLGAIERQGLDTLAERPGDMLELVQYWIDHKKFGTLTAMTEAAVAAKLNEPDKYRPDNTHLAYAKAREGAERLAAAMTLAKTFTLIAPAQEPDPSLASGALDPAALLDDWNVAECNALLRRGIFAPSTYGRVRFHHRSTQEYLASRWLKRLLENGCQRSEIFGLVFAECYGINTVVPSLRSAAAWLATHYPDIRDEIIRREPLLLITHGDPAALSTEDKTRVLLNLARKHAAGEIADDSIDRRALGMFASPQLSDAIRDAWKINTRPDFRGDLIRLVREGQVIGCVDLAAAMAGDAKEHDYFRITAVDALVACGADTALRRIAKELMRNPSRAGPRLATGFAKALFPKYLSVMELLTLIDKAQPPPKKSHEGFAYAIDELWGACPAADRPALLAGLADICSRPPFADEYQRVALRQAQLARHLGEIAYSAVSELGGAAAPAPLIMLLAVVERAERSPRLEGDGPHLNELVQRSPATNRALFWHDVAETRQNSGHAVEGYWQVHFVGSPLWELGPADLRWLREDLKSRPLHDDRRVALSAIAELLRPELKSQAPALRKLIGKNPALRKELNAYLRRPAVSPARRRMNARSAKHEEERKARRAKDEKSWREFREKLQADPGQLSDAAVVATGPGFVRLHNLGEWLHRKTRLDYIAAIREWRLLEPAFSREIAEAFRDGMKALWRVTAPEKLVRQPGGPISVKWVTIYAYAAVGLEAAENPRFAESLSVGEVHRAISHACLSQQGYPDWIDAAIAAHPGIAVPLVRDAFAEEWAAEESGVSDFLYHFAQNSVAIHPELRHAIFEIIRTVEPKQLHTLDRGLDVVRNLALSESQRAALSAIVLARFKAHASNKPMWAARYIALLFQLDGPAAAALLLKWLRGARPRKRKALTITVLGLLFGSHDPLIGGALAGLPVPALSQLVLFAYQEVRPDQDNVHEGLYEPDERDHAEGARNAILKALIDTEGASAYRAMVRLSDHRDMLARRIRFRELARRMAERDADVFAWRPAEVLAFERDKVLPVRTGAQLYTLAQRVIREIGWEFDNADASARAVLETAKDEDAVQNWLAAEMKHRAKGRYHATREPEIAEGNMPDILVSAVGAQTEVAVEAKHGGKQWSSKALEDSLRRQLAEDYLRPATRRHGVFVITNHRKRGWSHPKTGKRLSFAEMIAYLDDVAATINANAVGEIEVTVIGIDAVAKPRKRARTKPVKKTARRKPADSKRRIKAKARIRAKWGRRR